MATLIIFRATLLTSSNARRHRKSWTISSVGKQHHTTSHQSLPSSTLSKSPSTSLVIRIPELLATSSGSSVLSVSHEKEKMKKWLACCRKVGSYNLSVTAAFVTFLCYPPSLYFSLLLFFSIPVSGLPMRWYGAHKHWYCLCYCVHMIVGPLSFLFSRCSLYYIAFPFTGSFLSLVALLPQDLGIHYRCLLSRTKIPTFVEFHLDTSLTT